MYPLNSMKTLKLMNRYFCGIAIFNTCFMRSEHKITQKEGKEQQQKKSNFLVDNEATLTTITYPSGIAALYARHNIYIRQPRTV